ncbi:MAG: membrane protein insertase YidC [Lentisphaeria bacterium]|nr:membrane protein insertase YidC [Lentisphaeria bacterium]
MKHIDKENVIVIGIALALLIAWGIWYPKQQAKANAARQEQRAAEQAIEAKNEAARQYAEQQQAAAAPAEAQPAAQTPAPAAPAETQPAAQTPAAQTPAPAPVVPAEFSKDRYPAVTLGNDLTRFVIDPISGTVEKIELLKYDTSDRKGRIVYDSNVVPRRTFDIDGLDGWQLVALTVKEKVNADGDLRIDRRFRRGAEELLVVEVFSLPPDSYSLNLHVRLSTPGDKPVILQLFRVWSAGIPPMEQFAGDKLNGRTMHRIEYCTTTGKQMVSLDPAMKEEKFVALDLSSPSDWIGVTNKYFASLLFAEPYFDSGVNVNRTAYPLPGKKAGSLYYVPSIGGNYANVAIKPGESQDFKFRYFAGPKTLAEVKKLPESAMPILHLSSFSWMEYLARPVLSLLNYLKDFCGNYGLAIILLTLIVRIVFFPLTERGNRSMRKMSKIAPRAKEIREKYKDNPQLMNQKTMELYRQEGVNPLGGCLPILLQIPVFFALYAALDSAVELRHVSFLWMTDLTKPDLVGPQFFFGYGIHPLVIAMTVLMILQQRMTPSNMEPAQQKMMMFMPIIMLVFLYNLPSGLTLYWTVSQIFSIAQMKYSLYIAKRDEEKKDPALNQKSA